jgi:hypothetical protein
LDGAGDAAVCRAPLNRIGDLADQPQRPSQCDAR